LHIARIDDPIPALELQRPDGRGWFLAPLPARRRLRFEVRGWDRPVAVLVDTPRPGCPECEGVGGHVEEYGHPETGEYDGEDHIPCGCWRSAEGPLLTVPVPRWAARAWLGWTPPQGGWSEETPF
jgi:hypothetical protein